MKVEYLIIIDSGNPFCRDKKAFDNFLQSNADISIKGSSFKHKRLEVEYELQDGEIKTDKNRFFHIKLDCQDDTRIEEFQQLIRATSTLLHKASDEKPQILWNDVSFYYSELAYPKIHQIENLMRKLMTKFMLTNVGLGWTKEAIPEDLKKSSKTNSIENNNNYLYETDFKDLSSFLFDDNRTLVINKLIEKIKSIENDVENVPAKEIKGLLPKSNWVLYFQELVDCDESYLQARWDKLYKLRCKVAHNSLFTKKDYDLVCQLVKQVKPKIQDAIDNLDKVEVPEDEREEIAEIFFIKTHPLYGEYIQKWKLIEDYFTDSESKRRRLAPQIRIPGQKKKPETIPRPAPLSPMSPMEILESRRFLTPDSLYDEIVEANHIRNIIVHDSGHYFSADELRYRIGNLDKILNQLLNHLEEDDGVDPELRYADDPEARARYYESYEREDDGY